MRPKYFKKCIESVLKHLDVDFIYVYNDGSPKEDYQEIYDSLPKKVLINHSRDNKGVAKSKNWLLRTLYADGCDYIFLLEDDIIITDKQAVEGYIKVSEETGIGHLMYAHHGPMNVNRLIHSDENGIELYPHCVGAWCMYTRECIEKCGYMDTHFKNAWEHVEYTQRISLAGLTSEYGFFADVKDSNKWLAEQPDAIENSSIVRTKAWALATVQGLMYWKQKDPVNFPLEMELQNLSQQAGIVQTKLLRMK